MTALQKQDVRTSEGSGLLAKLANQKRFLPGVSLVSVVLLASWMGNADGGYFVGDWTLATFFLAVLLLIVSAIGMFSISASRWSTAARAASLPRTQCGR